MPSLHARLVSEVVLAVIKLLDSSPAMSPVARIAAFAVAGDAGDLLAAAVGGLAGAAARAPRGPVAPPGAQALAGGRHAGGAVAERRVAVRALICALQ